MKKFPVSIIIPVYKNYEMFFHYLEINKPYFQGCEVIIMNDYPETSIKNRAKKIHSEAVVVDNKKNLGFAGNVNKGIQKATRKYVLLINSDVVLRDDSFLKAISYFEKDEKLFAVGFAQMEKNGQTVGSNRGYFGSGLINHSYQQVTDRQSLVANFWAEGGSSIFRRKTFTDLGMLDDLFNPFYWEDVDLSYRAWKSGYKVGFAPEIKVEHHHESTIGKYFDQGRITKTAFRNQLIFNWKNLSDGNLIFNNLINIPKYVFKAGFFDAVLKLPQILKARKKIVKLFKKTDKEVLDIFNN